VEGRVVAVEQRVVAVEGRVKESKEIANCLISIFLHTGGGEPNRRIFHGYRTYGWPVGLICPIASSQLTCSEDKCFVNNKEVSPNKSGMMESNLRFSARSMWLPQSSPQYYTKPNLITTVFMVLASVDLKTVIITCSSQSNMED
jgi:hypothetical protein